MTVAVASHSSSLHMFTFTIWPAEHQHRSWSGCSEQPMPPSPGKRGPPWPRQAEPRPVPPRRQTHQPSCFQVPAGSQLPTPPAHRQGMMQPPSVLPHGQHVLCSSRTTAFPAPRNTPQTACTVLRDTATRSSPGPTLTTLPVLLNAVAVVVELGEGGGQLIQVVTERVQQQVLQDLLQDLREPQDALAQFPLLLMVQDEHLLPCCLPQHLLVDVGQASNSPAGIPDTACSRGSHGSARPRARPQLATRPAALGDMG